MDLLEAVPETVDKTLLSNERNDDADWDALNDRACEIANTSKRDIPIEKPRIVGRQRNILNIPACSVLKYYKRSVYFTFDNLMVKLEDRLVVHKGRFAAQSLIPSRLQELTIERQRDT